MYTKYFWIRTFVPLINVRRTIVIMAVVPRSYFCQLNLCAKCEVFNELLFQGYPYRFWHGRGTHGGGASVQWGNSFPTKSGGVSNKQNICIKVGLNSYFVLYSVKYRKNLYHFVKELYVRRKNRVKCPNNFGI